MAIAFGSAGAGAGTETSGAQLALACPATVNAGDILTAVVVWLNVTDAPSDPSGWTQLGGPWLLGDSPGVGRAWLYGKIADGTEDGTTINFGTAGGTSGRFGRIFRWTGRVSGSITDLIPSGQITGTPSEDDPPNASVTTSIAGARAVQFIAQDDNNSLTVSNTGVTGGTWVEDIGDFLDTAIGAQGCVLGEASCIPTADPGSVSGGNYTTAADEGVTIGLEIRPEVPVALPVPIFVAPFGERT